MKINKSVYFENLDSLRFFSFLSVFICHMVNYLPYVPKNSFDYSFLKYINKIGPLGVNFFFVLSGFLITYLLILEKNNNQGINLGHFYLRRVLRIWPLFYLILILGFGIYPYVSLGRVDTDILTDHLWKYLLFVNNFDRISTGFAGIGSDALGVMWTIAIEEQFYLIWPLIILFVKQQRLLIIFSFLILSSILFRAVYWYDTDIIYFHTLSVFSDLVVGSTIAYLIVYSSAFKLYIERLSRRALLLVYFVGLTFIYIYVNFDSYEFIIIFSRIAISLFFSFIILEQCFCNSSIIKLGRLTHVRKLGVISYGLYCLHLPAIGLMQKLNSVLKINVESKPMFIAQTIITLSISIAVSYLSYYFFERKFLMLKNKWQGLGTLQKN